METETAEPPDLLSARSDSPGRQTEKERLPGQVGPCNTQSRKGYRKSSALWTRILLADARREETDSQTVRAEADLNMMLSGALYDQGDHEVEVEAEGHEASVRWVDCQKHAGHSDFIKPPDFRIDDLPETHRDADIYSYIRLWSQLVVKVKVKYISLHRPQGYSFAKYRGKSVPISGTGKVAEITTVTDSPCPCLECRMSMTPHLVWKAVWVMTAMHVVFDDFEAVKTEIELFYDDPDNKDVVRTLRGIRVVDSNVKGDWCKFECATHDLDFGQKLDEIDTRVLELGKVIQEKHHAHNFLPLAVIASHPHGYSKHISIGEWKDRNVVRSKEDNYEWTEYKYTTSTCFGCSGAPVWIVGPDRTHYVYNYYNHVHSEGLENGLSKSGAGDVEKRWDD